MSLQGLPEEVDGINKCFMWGNSGHKSLSEQGAGRVAFGEKQVKCTALSRCLAPMTTQALLACLMTVPTGAILEGQYPATVRSEG